MSFQEMESLYIVWATVWNGLVLACLYTRKRKEMKNWPSSKVKILTTFHRLVRDSYKGRLCPYPNLFSIFPEEIQTARKKYSTLYGIDSLSLQTNKCEVSSNRSSVIRLVDSRLPGEPKLSIVNVSLFLDLVRTKTTKGSGNLFLS